MKKLFVVLLTAAVLVGCVMAAGCIDSENQPSAGGDTEEIPSEVAYSVYVTKEANTVYNVGDIIELIMVGNPGSGYGWYVLEGEDLLYSTLKPLKLDSPRLNTELLGQDEIAIKIEGKEGVVESEAIAIGSKVVDVDTPKLGENEITRFWFQTKKAGSFPFTIVYARANELDKPLAVYKDVIVAEQTDAPLADGPVASFTFDSFDINPAAGSYAKVITPANPTTGYYYTASGDGLSIIKNYVVDDETLVGSPGKYEWYVTAETAGEYEFKAVYKRSGSDDVITSFTLFMKFT